MSFSDFRPKGTTDGEILESMILKAKSLIEERDRIAVRHQQELDLHRGTRPEIHNVMQFERSAILRLLEMGEPVEFDYDFHEYRKIILENLDKDNPPKLADLFPEFCQRTSIRPLLLTILHEDTGMRVLYGFPKSAHELPELDLFAFDSQEIGFAILKLYVAFSEQYGAGELLNLLKLG